MTWIKPLLQTTALLECRGRLFAFASSMRSLLSLDLPRPAAQWGEL
jgi:hypothetical protein